MKKILLIFLLFGTLVFGETLVGKVIKVYDGDTITIMVDGEKEKIRFYGIDSLEIKQSYGIESMDFIRSRIMDEEVKVDVVNTDRYGRKIGKIYYNNGRSLNLESVETGNSW
ncbi:thermonuclease family protein (plasmid) [Fusobacteria bacterium ZRK30]|nr:thermonuclease family protein [Fusobacteria bacterium ZRK30]